jgi:hypothetical protein
MTLASELKINGPSRAKCLGGDQREVWLNRHLPESITFGSHFGTIIAVAYTVMNKKEAKLTKNLPEMPAIW